MSAYSSIYVDDIQVTQGRVFLNIRDELPGVDEKWFIEKYMKSDIRRLLDMANPKLAAKPSPELILAFIDRECGGEYKRGETWGGFLPQWVGEIYSLYQWKYETPSAELVELLPLAEMERLFVPLHQAGWDAAAKKLHDIVIAKSADGQS